MYLAIAKWPRCSQFKSAIFIKPLESITSKSARAQSLDPDKLQRLFEMFIIYKILFIIYKVLYVCSVLEKKKNVY